MKGLGAKLTRQIPWLRVFVEGVVIIGELGTSGLAAVPSGHRTAQPPYLA